MDLKKIIKKQREFYLKNTSKSYEFRMDKLRLLRKILADNKNLILRALEEDLSKSNFESYITEYGLVLEEIDYALKNLKKWMKVKKVRPSLLTLPSKSYYVYEPMGVNLIISPWNYPFFLSFGPVIGAIAAGNTIILKSSSKSKAMTKLIGELIGENFDPRFFIHLKNQEIDYDELIKLDYDHITYTGGPGTAKKIMKAQADKLTKLTLELGGKSPCIVDKGADIKKAAKKIAWAKTVNAGQTCIAPDYILAHRSIKDYLLENLIKNLDEFYPDPLRSKDLAWIINEDHFDRLMGLVDKNKLVYGGQSDKNRLKIGPIIMDNVSFSDRVMGEEIFGPIIPIIGYDDINRAVDKIRRRPKPLALYLFSDDEEIIKNIVSNVEFGNGAINECLMQIANPRLEFGGVGMSGMGGYHGDFGFINYSNRKSILRARFFDNFLKYPPHSEKKLSLIEKILK